MRHGAGYYCSLQTAGRTVMQSAVIQSRVYHSGNFGVRAPGMKRGRNWSDVSQRTDEHAMTLRAVLYGGAKVATEQMRKRGTLCSGECATLDAD